MSTSSVEKFTISFSADSMSSLDQCVSSLVGLRCEDSLENVPTFTKSSTPNIDYTGHHSLYLDGSAIMAVNTPETLDDVYARFMSVVVDTIKMDLAHSSCGESTLLSVKLFRRVEGNNMSIPGPVAVWQK